jgi:hypothetical protein
MYMQGLLRAAFKMLVQIRLLLASSFGAAALSTEASVALNLRKLCQAGTAVSRRDVHLTSMIYSTYKAVGAGP